MDANGNGLIERAEASGNTAERFGLIDENRDQLLSGAEMIRGAVNDVYPPTTTFSDRHTVTLGGKRVMLVYTGEAHDPASAVIYFPDERTVFGADTLQAKRFPGGLGPNVGAWIKAIGTINELDYDVAATGHAMMGTKADIVALQAYLEDLAVGVAAGVAAGKSLQEIQESLTLDKYSDWDRYDTQRPTHIAAVFATLKGNPVTASASRASRSRRCRGRRRPLVEARANRTAHLSSAAVCLSWPRKIRLAPTTSLPHAFCERENS